MASPADDNKKPTVGSSTDRQPKKRINKPLIEKRRRERINECLNQLQTMITQLDKDKSKRTRSSKLEKADILEMTVEFIKNGQKNTKDKIENSDKDVSTLQYMAGYKKCVDEINTFFKKTDNISPELKSSILGHVSKTLNTEPDSSVQSVDKKTDEKHHVNYSNCAAIKPKLLPNVNGSQQPNALPPSSSGLVLQQPSVTQISTPNVNQVAVVCNREIPTYVLVPTATLCQSVQLSVGSQTDQNGPLPVALLNNNAFNSGNYLNTSTNGISTNYPQTMNSGQLVVLPPTQAQHRNCVMGGNFQSPLTMGGVNSHTNIINRPLEINLQQQQALESDNDVWRPW